MPWDYCPGFCISFMRFSGHVIVDKPKLCTSIRLQSQDVHISDRLPGNCAQIITWCFATPIHGLNWIGYYYPGTYDTSISWGHIKLVCDLANTCTWFSISGGPHSQGEGSQEAQAGQGQVDGGSRRVRRQGDRPQDRRDHLQAQVRAQGPGVCLNPTGGHCSFF